MIELYLTWLADARNATAGSVRTYRNTLAALPSGSIDSSGLELFLRRPPLRAARTRAKEAAILRGYYGWCHRRGLITTDPTVDLAVPKAPPTQPRPIGDNAWLAAWTAPLPARARFIMGAAMFAGLRREEIARLRPSHVQWGPPLMLVGFTRKGGGDATLPLGDLLDVWAKRLPQLEVERWLPTLEARSSLTMLAFDRASQAKRDPSSLNQYLRPYMPFGPHALRHSFCTNLIRAGLPLAMVQKLANHASPATTSGYIQVGGGEVREWLAAAR